MIRSRNSWIKSINRKRRLSSGANNEADERKKKAEEKKKVVEKDVNIFIEKMEEVCEDGKASG